MALIVVRAAPGNLTPPGGGLSTHDAAASALVDDSPSSFGEGCDCLVASATMMRLPRFKSSNNPVWLAVSDGRGLHALDAIALAAVGDC